MELRENTDLNKVTATIFSFASLFMSYWRSCAQALAVYFYGGNGCSFQCCCLVFRFSSCLLKRWCMAQIQGFILLALREFPEVLFLGLFNDSGDIVDLLAARVLESLEASPPIALATCSWDSATLRCFSLLPGSQDLNLGHGCTGGCRWLLAAKEQSLYK